MTVMPERLTCNPFNGIASSGFGSKPFGDNKPQSGDWFGKGRDGFGFAKRKQSPSRYTFAFQGIGEL